MPSRATSGEPSGKLSQLASRLAEAEETLRAIAAGEVDAVVTCGRNGPQVFTLEGADHAYRVLIESMNEGAVTLTTDMTILYANQCFSRMVECPLEQVTGSSFRRFLSAADRAALLLLVKPAAKAGSKIQVHLPRGSNPHSLRERSGQSLSLHGSAIHRQHAGRLGFHRAWSQRSECLQCDRVRHFITYSWRRIPHYRAR